MTALRGSRIVYVNNANSVVFTFPAGSTAGDSCLIIAGHGFAVNLPSGWTSLNSSTGTNVNGAAFTKVLTSGDITTGSVTITFSGIYYGVVSGITTVGAIDHFSEVSFSRNSFGALSRNVTTGALPVVGEYAVYFGYGRGNITITSSGGTPLQTTSNLNASAVLTSDALVANGPVSSTFGFSASPTGDYEGIIVLSTSPVNNPKDEVFKAGVVVTVRPPQADIVSKAGVVVTLRPPQADIVSKVGVVIVLRPSTGPPPDSGSICIVW